MAVTAILPLALLAAPAAAYPLGPSPRRHALPNGDLPDLPTNPELNLAATGTAAYVGGYVEQP